MEAAHTTLHSPINSAFIYDMQAEGEKVRLGRDLWMRDFANDLAALRAANPELVAVLEAQISN